MSASGFKVGDEVLGPGGEVVKVQKWRMPPSADQQMRVECITDVGETLVLELGELRPIPVHEFKHFDEPTGKTYRVRYLAHPDGVRVTEVRDPRGLMVRFESEYDPLLARLTSEARDDLEFRRREERQERQVRTALAGESADTVCGAAVAEAAGVA